MPSGTTSAHVEEVTMNSNRKGGIFMRQLYLRAMGKINLGLDVLGVLPNGYHEVRMVMQMVNLYDQITLKESKKPEISITTNLHYLPTNENNLVYKAARLLMDEFEIKKGLSIHLYKYLPVAAGMAGGSSDAACVLVGVNRMFHLGLSMEELMKRGVTIGADVPYCLLRSTALAEGIGEQLTALPPMPDCHILIGKPPVSVSTKFVYENLDMQKDLKHPAIDDTLKALSDGDLPALATSMGNVLETVTIPHYPEIDAIKQCMLENGALNAMMSGSGPTVFGIFEKKDAVAAKQALAALKAQNIARQIYLTTPYNPKKR